LGFLLSIILINCQIFSKKQVFTWKMSMAYRYFYTFLSQKWHFDQVISELFVVKTMNFGYNISFKLIDKGNIESFGPLGLTLYLKESSHKGSERQSGLVFHYAFSIVFSFLAFLSILFFFLFFTSSLFYYQFLVIIFCYVLCSLSF
jgi:hypothetical protein